MIDLDDAPSQFASLDASLKKRGINWITGQSDFNAIRALCESWYRDYRPAIVSTVGELDSVLAIDAHIDWLRGRVGMRTDTAKLRSTLREISRSLTREVLPAYDTARWSSATEAALDVSNSDIERRLRIVEPGLGDSYQQALRDLADHDRTTYLGPAAELREVLRSAIDALAAPMEEIKQQPWYKGHDGRPTQAERIRSILGSKERSDQPINALEVIDSAVGAIGRSTYNRASRSVHAASQSDRDEVERLRGWVDVVLAEILPS